MVTKTTLGEVAGWYSQKLKRGFLRESFVLLFDMHCHIIRSGTAAIPEKFKNMDIPGYSPFLIVLALGLGAPCASIRPYRTFLVSIFSLQRPTSTGLIARVYPNLVRI
jgi:hypothetical protein